MPIIRSNHCATAPYLRPMYVADVYIQDALNTYPAVGVFHITSVVLCNLLLLIWISKLKGFPSTAIVIAYGMYHNSNPNNSTDCTTTR